MEFNFNDFIKNNDSESIVVDLVFKNGNWKEIFDNYLITKNGIQISFNEIEEKLKEIIDEGLSSLKTILFEDYQFNLSITSIKVRKNCLDIALGLVGTFLYLSQDTTESELTDKQKEERMKRNTLLAIAIFFTLCFIGAYACIHLHYGEERIDNKIEIMEKDNTIKALTEENEKLKNYLKKVYPNKKSNLSNELQNLSTQSPKNSIYTIINEIEAEKIQPNNNVDSGPGM